MQTINLFEFGVKQFRATIAVSFEHCKLVLQEWHLNEVSLMPFQIMCIGDPELTGCSLKRSTNIKNRILNLNQNGNGVSNIQQCKDQ